MSDTRTMNEKTKQNSVFFIDYIVLLGLGDFPLELARFVPLVLGIIKQERAVTDSELQDAFDPGTLNYADAYSKHLCSFVIIVRHVWRLIAVRNQPILTGKFTSSYAVISPVIIPFGFFYFGLALLVFKYQVIWLGVRILLLLLTIALVYVRSVRTCTHQKEKEPAICFPSFSDTS